MFCAWLETKINSCSWNVSPSVFGLVPILKTILKYDYHRGALTKTERKACLRYLNATGPVRSTILFDIHRPR